MSDIEYLWWAQRAREDDESKLFAITAGLGSGKTHGAVQVLYDKLARNPSGKCWFYSMPIYELIHNTAIPKTQKVLEAFGYEEGADYTIVKSPYPKCCFKATGQEIHYVSGNRPDKIKSVEYCGGVIDEPGVTKHDSIKRLRERSRDRAVKNCQILLPGTPEGINHYAEEFDSDKNAGWDRSQPRDHVLVRRTDEGEVRLRRFRLTTYDNQHHLPPGYISDILDTHRGNPAFIQSYVHGFFVPLITGGCYANYKPQKHDIEDIEPSPHIQIYLTFDFNADPLAWVACQESRIDNPHRRGRPLIAIHNADQNCGQLDDACVEFATKFNPARFGDTPILLYGDSSGYAQSHKTRNSDYDQVKRHLRNLGFRRVEICAMRSNPLETATVGALNDALLDDAVLVCKRCKMLRTSLGATRWKEGERKIEKKAGETHTHHGDAMKYLVFALREGASRRVLSVNA